jgi:ankyrin repeat protein
MCCVLLCALQKSKYRALHLAAMSGSAAVVEVLLEAGAWVDARSQVTLLLAAAPCRHCAAASLVVHCLATAAVIIAAERCGSTPDTWAALIDVSCSG